MKGFMHYSDEHPEHARMLINYSDVIPLDCFFEKYTGNLHFAYAGGVEINDILSNTAILILETEFRATIRKWAEQQRIDDELDRAIDKWQTQQLDKAIHK
jgi:hypothetical protein